MCLNVLLRRLNVKILKIQCCGQDTVNIWYKNCFAVGVTVVSKHPRFALSTNELSSGLRYSAYCVRAVNG